MSRAAGPGGRVDRDRSPAPHPLPRAGGRALRLRRARRGDARPERRPPRLAHPLRPGPPRAGGGLHGGRLGAAHRPGGRLPGDPRARRDEPHHGPGRREPRPGARGGDHRPARARPPPQGVPPVRRHRGGVPALHEVEHADRDGRGHPRGRAEGLQGRPGGEARGVPPRAAGGRGRGARRGRAPPRLPAAPPVARPAVARARGGHREPRGPPADPRGERRDPGTRRAGAARPGRARPDPGGDDVHGQGRLARRPSRSWSRRSDSSPRTSSAPGSRRRTSSWPSATTRWSTRRPAGTRRARAARPHRLHGGRGGRALPAGRRGRRRRARGARAPGAARGRAAPRKAAGAARARSPAARGRLPGAPAAGDGRPRGRARAGGPRHLGRRRPQALGRQGVRRAAPEHGDRLERLRRHGDRPPGGDRRQARPAGAAGW